MYIEVTFDDNKKTDDDTAIQITRDICARTTYEEVDFTATADLANTWNEIILAERHELYVLWF